MTSSTHCSAPLPSSDSDADSDTSPTAADLRHTDLSATIFRSYLEITGRSSPDLTKIQSFLTSSRSGALSCLICLERIRPTDPTWSCAERCFAVFHLLCIQGWARQSSLLAAARAASLWNCPKCRIEYPQTLIPKQYLCFCQKLVDPPSDPWILPHSCGEICNRPLKHNCGHHCLLLCHPGPCPSCPKLVKSRCFCGTVEDMRRCGFKDFSCNGVGSKLLDCGTHWCGENCHEGGVLAVQGEGGCTGASVGGWRRRESVVTGVSGVRLLGFGKHLCGRGCHSWVWLVPAAGQAELAVWEESV